PQAARLLESGEGREVDIGELFQYTLENHSQGPPMLLPRTATLIVQGFVGLALMQTPSKAWSQNFHEERSVQRIAVRDAPPQSCPVTLPSEAIFVPPYPVPTSSAAHFGLTADGKFGTEK